MANVAARNKLINEEIASMKDKIEQYKSLLLVNEKHFKLTQEDTNKVRRSRYEHIKSLKKDIELMRREITTVVSGDFQRMHNVLQDHKEFQLGLQHLGPEKVRGYLEQVVLKHVKEYDRLRFKKTQKEKALIKIKEQIIKLNKEPSDQTGELPKQYQREQTLTSLIENAHVKQNAALAIKQTYDSMLHILRKDRLFFEKTLERLTNDYAVLQSSLSRVMLMDQDVSKVLQQIQKEVRQLEAETIADMRERDSSVKAMQQKVMEQYNKCKALIREEAPGASFRRDTEMIDEEALSLPLQLAEIEETLDRFQEVMIVTKYDDIVPRLQEQTTNKIRLLRQLEDNVSTRDSLLEKKEHAEFMLRELQHSGIEETKEYNRKREELKKQIQTEKEKKKAAFLELKEKGEKVVDIRVSLKTIYNILRKVDPDYKEKESPDVEDREEDALEDIKDPIVLLDEIKAKATDLMNNVIGLNRDLWEEAEENFHQTMLKQVGPKQIRVEMQEEEETVLCLESDGEIEDGTVVTRTDVKNRSNKIMERLRKPKRVIKSKQRSEVREHLRSLKWI